MTRPTTSATRGSQTKNSQSAAPEPGAGFVLLGQITLKGLPSRRDLRTVAEMELTHWLMDRLAELEGASPDELGAVQYHLTLERDELTDGIRCHSWIESLLGSSWATGQGADAPASIRASIAALRPWSARTTA